MYNKPDQGLQVQPGHWFCDDKGKNWGWKRPWAPGWTVYASGWMTFEDFKQAQARETEPNLPMPDAKTPEFDL